METVRRHSFSEILSATQEPLIVLRALTGLRWFAVVGQITAVAVAVMVFSVQLPLVPIAVVIFTTAFSNLILQVGMRWGRPPAGLAVGVLLLDVGLLTQLLYLTGGPENPFAALYLVHVAMAVIVLPRGWTWVVVGVFAGCYGLLLGYHRPLTPLPGRVLLIGNWTALVLISVLIATFIGWVIRALRQRESELVRMRDRAAKNEQLAALTTLAAGAAHELGTPLGTIAVVSKELELAISLEGIRDDARLIRGEVDRCRTILNRMRFDTGEDDSRTTPVDLRLLVERLKESLSGSEQGRLAVRFEPGVEFVFGPPRALEQSLLVLLRNAFDASDLHSEVVLEITREEGPMVRFMVYDKGQGMSEEMLRRAGEPFFTTKEPGRGMGLGLYLVRLVAERCGARFHMQSSQGEGTRAFFDLPDTVR